MTIPFLSDEWFAKLEEFGAEFENFSVSPKLSNFVVNVTATCNDGENREFTLKNGRLEQGHQEMRSLHITLPINLAKKAFIFEERSAVVMGIMKGNIKVEGDLTRLSLLQTVKPSDDQKAMLVKLRSITDR